MKIRIVFCMDPNGKSVVWDIPDNVNLGKTWLDHEKAVEPYMPEGWFLVGIGE